MTKLNIKKRVRNDDVDINDDNSIDEICSDLKKKQIKYNANAIIYCRVSTKNQTTGTSLETQINAGTNYCTTNNFKMIEIINEVCSAKEMTHQSQLINAINSNHNVNLIVYEPSRLSRNISDFTQLLHICQDKNITIHFVADGLVTTNNNDVKIILSAVYDGETEIKTLSKRVKASVEQRKKNKTYLPSISKYGYAYVKSIVGNKIIKSICKENYEQKVIELINMMYWGCTIKSAEVLIKQLTDKPHKICDWSNPDEQVTKIAHGNMRFIDIAEFLNSIELFRRGKPWNANSISDIINGRNLMEVSIK